MTQKSQFSRRNALKYGGALVGTSLVATVLGGQLIAPEPTLAQNTNVTPDEALKKLIDGNNRFINEKRTKPNQGRDRVAEVAESQAPFAAILGCADSRTPSEIVFDQGLGDLFVCRIAGNIATSEEIGSLEFGTMVLGAKVILVMGHERCGAVKAAIEGGNFPGQIGRLIDGLQVGVERANQESGKNKLDNAIRANVRYQVEKLGKSTVIGDLVNKGVLKVVGAVYDLDTGKVDLLS